MPRPSSLRAPRQLQRAKAAANAEGPSTRREALWALAAAASLLAPLPASAAADGSPLRAVLRAPYEFYRSRQQQNDGAKILAPIRASRQKLQARARPPAPPACQAGSPTLPSPWTPCRRSAWPRWKALQAAPPTRRRSNRCALPP